MLGFEDGVLSGRNDKVDQNGDGISDLSHFNDDLADVTGIMESAKIPAPGTLAVFGAAGLAAVRRRR